MDFRHLIVTCLFSMLRLPFDNQKVKGNYAIFRQKIRRVSDCLCSLKFLFPGLGICFPGLKFPFQGRKLQFPYVGTVVSLRGN